MIWKRDTSELMKEFLNLGFRTVIVCFQGRLGDFVGKVINQELISNLPKDVDVSGESGEFHTFAFAGPIFENTIKYQLGEKVFKEYKPPKNADDNCFQAEDEKARNLGFCYVDLVEQN